MIKKLSLLSILTTFLVVNCGVAIPRTTVLEPKDSAQEHQLDACGIKITIPAKWKLEAEPSVPPVLHAVKDKIDIVIDVITEKDVEKVSTKMIEKIKTTLNKEIVGGRVAKNTTPNKIEVTTIYTMSADKKDSADVDVILCPSGAGSLVLYTYSPIATYNTDRAAVLAITNSAKSTKEEAAAPAKKK
ncbi:MAG: hypothetical protein H7A24_11055 [Leptospiraceae bacterium]|nr:hypothetical protein [Leptospiraceae bacterium]MCP5512411.1 hypothetical protein [Leptospiraceae bacterium]